MMSHSLNVGAASLHDTSTGCLNFEPCVVYAVWCIAMQRAETRVGRNLHHQIDHGGVMLVCANEDRCCCDRSEEASLPGRGGAASNITASTA